MRKKVIFRSNMQTNKNHIKTSLALFHGSFNIRIFWTKKVCVFTILTFVQPSMLW